MCGSAAWLMKNAPDRLTAITLYQSSSVIFSTVLSIVMPALLTSTSSRPWRSITSSIGAPAIVRRADVALVDARGHAVRLAAGAAAPPPAPGRGCSRRRRPLALRGEAAARSPPRSRGCRRSRTPRARSSAAAGCRPGTTRRSGRSCRGAVYRSSWCSVSVLINPSPPLALLTHLAVRALGQPRGRSQARAPCAPPSRRPARCARRDGRGVRRPRSRSGRRTASCPDAARCGRRRR